MTLEEVETKFKDVHLEFEYYYKFKFYYSAMIPGYLIEAVIGGSADDIYSFEVVAGEKYPVCPVEENWYALTVKTQDENYKRELVFDYDDI